MTLMTGCPCIISHLRCEKSNVVREVLWAHCAIVDENSEQLHTNNLRNIIKLETKRMKCLFVYEKPLSVSAYQS